MCDKRKITVGIAGSCTLCRQGIRCILDRQQEIAIAGEAADGGAAAALVRSKAPDVLLLEIPLPPRDAIDLTKDIVALRTTTKVLTFGSLAAPGQALRILRAGARGYLSTNANPEEMLAAVRRVHAGKVYLPSELQRTFAESYLQPGTDQEPEARLTDREFQVMCLLASGHTNKEIAGRLIIGIKTVDTHRMNILRKLCLRNNADIARFALTRQLVSP